jgi:hypothetical protein
MPGEKYRIALKLIEAAGDEEKYKGGAGGGSGLPDPAARQLINRGRSETPNLCAQETNARPHNFLTFGEQDAKLSDQT